MAPYYRVSLIIFEPDTKPVSDYLQGVDYVTHEVIAERVKHNPRWIKLVLKPLSKITDADIIEVAKIEMYDTNQLKEIIRDVSGNLLFASQAKSGHKKPQPVGQCIQLSGNDLFIDSNDGSDGHPSTIYPVSLKSYQYLISQGYDLSHYLLGGKTLQEANLAIYL